MNLIAHVSANLVGSSCLGFCVEKDFGATSTFRHMGESMCDKIAASAGPGRVGFMFWWECNSSHF